MTEEDYKTKINVTSEQAYDEISSFIGNISVGCKGYVDGFVYFLDVDGVGAARVKTNSKKRTVELTDMVDEWIFDSINHINKQEKVR